MTLVRRRLALAAAGLLFIVGAGPALASSYRPGNLLPVLCNPALGSTVAQEFPYGYTDEGRYYYIAGLWSWSATDGYRWLGWSDWHYLDPSDANQFVQTSLWRRPDGDLTGTWSWSLPGGTPQQWYVTVNYLYNTVAGAYRDPWYSEWQQC